MTGITDNISHVDPTSCVFLLNNAMVILTIDWSEVVKTVLLVSTDSYVLAIRVHPRVHVN